ncbi:MAG: hypothetical protein KY468_04895 [Armatimonadetes bacterium]|nr:hypothetical protein [Armatimonadota bacterium]
MEWFKAVLQQLPTAATNPLAFVAYVAVVIAWVVVAVKVSTYKVLMSKLDHIPSEDRRNVLEIQMGPMPEHISPKDYLELKKRQYLLFGFLTVCGAVVMLFAMATVRAGNSGNLTVGEETVVKTKADIFDKLYPQYERLRKGEYADPEIQKSVRSKIYDEAPRLADQMLLVSDQQLDFGYEILKYSYATLPLIMAASVSTHSSEKKDWSDQAIISSKKALALLEHAKDMLKNSKDPRGLYKWILEDSAIDRTRYYLAIALAINAKENGDASVSQVLEVLNDITPNYKRMYPPASEDPHLEWALKQLALKEEGR